MADGIELGKAYVQIVPSAQGIKSHRRQKHKAAYCR